MINKNLSTNYQILLFGIVFMIFGRMSAQETGLDQYGGWKGLKFEKTGFFYLAKKGDKDWLVSPEGNAFLINQLDHVKISLLRTSYNKDYWAKKFGLDSNSYKGWNEHFQKKVYADQKVLGFNTLFSYAQPIPDINYIGLFFNVRNAYWSMQSLDSNQPNIKPTEYPDVFSKIFAVRIDKAAKRVVLPKKDDPRLIAWHFTDSPILVEYDAVPKLPGFYHKKLVGADTFPQRLRNLGPEAAGKQAYVELMKERYKSKVENFNDTYLTDFASWNDLLKAENWKPKLDYRGNFREEADNMAFLLKILDKAYEVQVAAVKKYDPNHLILGDRINGNSFMHDEILKIYGKHFDMISYQFYGTWEDHYELMERFHRVTGKPVHSADSCFSVAKKEMPNPLGIVAVNQEIRAKHFKESYYKAYSLPYFIGWGWCGWMDRWPSNEPQMQHAGLQDPFGKWDQPIVNDMKAFADNMYEVHQTGDSTQYYQEN